jgi:hypothetical protein
VLGLTFRERAARRCARADVLPARRAEVAGARDGPTPSSPASPR